MRAESQQAGRVTDGGSGEERGRGRQQPDHVGSRVLEKGLYFHFTCSEFKGEGKTRSSLRHHASCFVENGHGG